MPEWTQTAVVALAAVGAGTILARRVFGMFRPSKGGACPSCESGSKACAQPEPTEPSVTVHPMTLVRSTSRAPKR